MKTITEQKPFEEILECIEKDKNIYIIGCGTCATMCHTGGKAEVLSMKEKLESLGKNVVGWIVMPTACDDLTADAMREDSERIKNADAILVMACAFGTQTVASFEDERPVYPALNTLFVGKGGGESGIFAEICQQCGDCVLAVTGGICPVTMCAKGLLNGPCGGTNKGKCEEDPERDCAWTLIYKRLEKLGKIDEMRKYRSPRNYQKVARPGKILIETEGVNK
ncbi:TPA: 5,10-methylenetetrahydrofolate reductase [Candidatus Poribacteria bacterium]|nr:5,10-methylenetetrahydrofolate reductase [Candidatus Poribacteria bacterium]